MLTDEFWQAAQRTLAQTCGVNMNTWFVGNHPVGHFVNYIKNAGKNKSSPPPPSSSPSTPAPSQSTDAALPAGEKTFFMKGRIMAGQADIEGNEMDVEDFRWLAKEEIQNTVTPQYWASVKNMLVEQ